MKSPQIFTLIMSYISNNEVVKLESDYIDKFIGHKIKDRRKVLKLSQTKLAELLGLSYQQIQKYENGSNKVTVKRLLQLSKILNVPASFFYEGLQLDEDSIGDSIKTDVIKQERTRPLNLLLVEDNAGDELLMRKAVEESGEIVNFHAIQDPEKVIDYIRNAEKKFGSPRPDIIILDLNMPKKSGIEVLKQVKKDHTISDIPIVILTNSISVKEMMEVYKHNASGFIPKSVDYIEFADDVAITIKYWSRVVILPSM